MITVPEVLILVSSPGCVCVCVYSGVGESGLGGLGLSLVNVGIQGGGGLLWYFCVLLLCV